MHSAYLAHSENALGNAHELRAHLVRVMERAQDFARTPRQKRQLALAALLHDLGKYRKAFQSYLRNGGVRGSVPHARWGAMLARYLKAEAASFAIDGHHAGLPDYSVWAHEHTFPTSAEEQQTLRSLLEAFKTDTDLTEQYLLGLSAAVNGTAREKDMQTRFLFSCLTDADWLDTEEHFAPEKTALRTRPVLQADVAIRLVDAELARLETHPSPLTTLRTQARLQALEKAQQPVGFFSLNLPTGLGKTLTSFRWALEHARSNNLERIIIVLPYTSIIDQTASRLKAILAPELGPGAVLEHHASYMPDAEDKGEPEDRRKLACENWDHPIIITTTVQFFETLFSNRPGKCRKLHNISNAVVILDEVQTLRKDLVLPTLDMLQDVQDLLETSFVFCTATMPAFEQRPTFAGVARITELVDGAERFFAATQRVRFQLLEALAPMSPERLAAAVRAQTASTLVICNTKKLPRILFDDARGGEGWDAVHHLSTGMCPHHRKAIIQEITEALWNKAKILVFSTQLVEAGVDLDFPCVFRELAPLESVIQAAGRCNREGKLPEPGTVTLFCMENPAYPDPSYRTQTRHVHEMLSASPECLYAYSTFHGYYESIMDLYITQKSSLEKPITATREQQDFAAVAAQYRVIENNTQPVFVWSYNEDSKKLYETLRAKERHALPLSRDEFRAIQQYTVQLYEAQLYTTAGSWEKGNSGVVIWNGDYDMRTGIRVDGQTADALIL